ncbi:MAG: prepilin-type N-terminal cleavage/methylation domain-containing protein [Pseudomonadota bacterium]
MSYATVVPESCNGLGLAKLMGRASRGFTILEFMMVLAIVGLLASIALPFYSDYQMRSRMVEVTAFMGEVNTAIMAELSTSGEFPDQLLGSQSRIAARQQGQPRVRRRDSRVRPDSGLIQEWYYEYNPRRQFAYVAIRLNRQEIPDCRGRCMLHLAFTTVNNELNTVCGRWNRGYWRDPFPPRILPYECDSTNVNRELRRIRRRR